MKLTDIRAVRDFTVYVEGKAVEIKKGWQKVEQEVADHWFVKAQTDNHGTDEGDDTRDAQIVELSGQLGVMKERLANAEASAAGAVANETKLAEVTAERDAAVQARDNALVENIALTTKVADLQATIDLSAAPTDNTAAVTKRK